MLTSGAHAAIRTDSWLATNTVPRNDDGYVGPVSTGFSLNFFDVTYTSLWVNNNGNVSFDMGLYYYTPWGLNTPYHPMIAPFFSDVDTRYAGLPVTYGTGTVDGRNAFGVNWLDVDYYYSDAGHTNRDNFQMLLIDRSDINPGDFDIEFNYGSMMWETGQASGGDGNGRGGTSASIGYTNGTGEAGTFYSLPGSLVPGSFIDGGPYALEGDRLLFPVRNGTPGPVTPELSSGALLLLGALPVGLGWWRRRKQ